MSDLKKFGKKLFTMSVVAMTIAWSVGLSALVPAGVAAAACTPLSAGDLFKISGNAAVYLVSPSMQRMYFPHKNVYATWFGSDFSKVKTIDTTCVDAYPNGGGLNFRSGSVLIKSVISPSVYAVGAGGVKMKITSPEVAAALYGSNWAKLIIDQADAFDALYSVGSELTSAVPHDGMLVKGTDGVVYSVAMGKLVKVEGTLPYNLLSDVRTVTDAVKNTLSVSTETVTPASIVANPSQKTGGTTTPPVVVSGNLTVSLAADTPASGYAMKNAARVAFTRVVFTAGAEAVTVDSFKVKRTGVGTDADFATINVVDSEGNLLNDSGKTPNSDHEVTFTEDVVVPANSSKTYTLVGDMAAAPSAGNVPKLALTAVTLVGTGTVSGLPVEGNAMTTNTSVTVASVTLAQGSTIGTVTKQVGTAGVNFMNLKVTNNTSGSDAKDVKVEKVVLYNTGTVADTDVSNFKLKYAGTVVATGVMKNKYLTFDLSACTADCTLAKGYDKTYEVYGDLTGGSGRTVEMYVYAATHVLAKDVTNNVYITPTNNAANTNINDIINVSQGKLNVTKTDTVPTGNVPGNATGIALVSFNYKVTGEPIDVRKTVFKITTTGTVTPAGLDSLVLYDSTGKALIGGVDGVGAAVGVGYATSSDTFTLQPGDNMLTVKATIDSTAVANDTIKIDLDMSNTSNFIARGVNSALDITIAVYGTPQALVQGPTKTVNTSALTVTTLTTPAAATFAPGVTNVTFVKVMLDASASSEDIKVTQFKAEDLTSATAKTIDIQNLRLFVDKDGDSYNGTGTPVAVGESLGGADSDAGDNETFTWSLSGEDQFIVKAGKKLVVEIKGDVVAGATAGSHTFSTNGTDFVTATGQTTKNQVTETIASISGSAMTVGTAGGQLEVSLSSDNPNARLMAAGTTVSLAAFKFLATTTEDVEMDYMYLTQVVTDTASSSYMDYDEIWFEDVAGTEIAGTRMSPTSTKPLVNFTDNAFVVKTTDGGKVLFLKGKLAAIGSGSNGVAAHQLGYKITALADVVAKGDLSGTGSLEWLSATTPTGNTHYVYKAYPVFAKKSLATADTKLVNGTRNLFTYQISAVNGDISLYGFTFDVATTTASLTASTLYLYDVTDANEVQVNITGGTGTYFATGAVWQTVGTDWTTSYSGSKMVVSVAKPRTYMVRGNVAGATTGAAVTVGMAGDSAGLTGVATNMLTAANVDSQSNDDFIWSDQSNDAHSSTSADWTNGFLVSGLSSTTSTLETVAY